MAHILVVDDEESIRALIREHIDPKFTPWSKR